MSIDHFSEFVAIVLAVSFATERLVLIIRTPFFKLNDEKKESDKDKGRRFSVQLLSLACAIATTGFLSSNTWDILDSIQISGGTDPVTIPLLIIAVLATGGSSLWKTMLGYTKAVRDIRKEDIKILKGKTEDKTG